MNRIAPAVLALLFGAVVAAPVPKDVKKVPPMDGTWEVVEWHDYGEQMKPPVGLKWVIEGSDLKVERSKARAARPKGGPTHKLVKPDGANEIELDHVITPPNGKARTLRGVYELDGDTLKFCWADDGTRPASCKPTADNSLYVFKRVEK